jgi:hypothetical protein
MSGSGSATATDSVAALGRAGQARSFAQPITLRASLSAAVVRSSGGSRRPSVRASPSSLWMAALSLCAPEGGNRSAPAVLPV